MDKIGGWEQRNEQEDRIGASSRAIAWIYTKSVVCMMNNMTSIAEAVHGAWEIQTWSSKAASNRSSNTATTCTVRGSQSMAFGACTARPHGRSPDFSLNTSGSGRFSQSHQHQSRTQCTHNAIRRQPVLQPSTRLSWNPNA